MKRKEQSFFVFLMVITIMQNIVCAQNTTKLALSKTIIFDHETHQIFEEIYEYNFFTADSLIANYKKNHPSSLWSNMLYANYYWWLIMSGEEHNKDVKDKFEKQLNAVINSLQKSKKKLTDDDLYIITSAYAFKSRLNLLNSDYLKGLLNLNNCIDFIEKSLDKEEYNEKFLITSGLLKYFIEYSKQHYPISRAYLLTLPDGSKKDGIKLLNVAGKSADMIIANEGGYFLTKIFQEVEKDYASGLKHSAILAKKYPNNILYQFNYYDCLLNLGKKEEAMKTLIKIHHLSKTHPHLTKAQRDYFINKAKKASEEYYKKQGAK